MTCKSLFPVWALLSSRKAFPVLALLLGLALGQAFGETAAADSTAAQDSVQGDSGRTDSAKTDTVKTDTAVVKAPPRDSLGIDTTLVFTGRPGEKHPRLWVTDKSLDSIRRAILVPGSHHRRAFKALLARVHQREPAIYHDVGGAYRNNDRSFLAREAAFAYLMTGDTTYTNLAYETLRTLYFDRTFQPNDQPDHGNGLARATVGLGFAMAYDFGYHGFTEDQRTWIKWVIEKSLNEWTELEYPKKQGNHAYAPYHSNWVPVCRGGEMVMMLAVYQEKDTRTGIYLADAAEGGGVLPSFTRQSRFAHLKSVFNAHLHAYGSLGVTGEGYSYGNFSGTFLIPTLLALRSVGDTSLEPEAYRHAWWRWIMNAASFLPQRRVLQNGTAAWHDYQDGWSSLMLGWIPKAELPQYLHFYDRYIGVRSTTPDAENFDMRRAGTVWSLIYYPAGLASQDPTGRRSPMTFDPQKGLFFFRDRYRDAEDVQISFNTDPGSYENAWNQPEAFQLAIIGKGTAFTEGPDRKFEPDLYTNLLVNGKAFTPNSSNEPSDTGFTAFAQGSHTGGYVIANGSQKFRNLGLPQAYRHCLVDFFHQEAVVSTLDSVVSLRENIYTWQLRFPDSGRAGPVNASSGEEDGRPFFLLQGRNGSYLKGWVLTSTGVHIHAVNPVRVNVAEKSTRIWTVLLIGKGEPPKARISGRGMDSRFEAGEVKVAYSAALDRIYMGEPPIYSNSIRRMPRSTVPAARLDPGKPFFVRRNAAGRLEVFSADGKLQQGGMK